MEQYVRVRGKRRVEAIAAAITASGGVVVRAPDPSIAPFEFEVRLPDGKHLNLICYAFTANKYAQEGRPADEHRLQVKYGSDFKRPHDIYIDPTQRRTTLFFGVHEAEDLFIAVDPAMHNPTWFSRSIEFKDHHVRGSLRTGWLGWDRERVASGRRRVLPQESFSTEALLGFTPKHFLTYASFERVATAMETGERLLLIKNIGDDLKRGGTASSIISARLDLVGPATAEHKLLTQFDLPIADLLDLIADNPRLKTAVRGGVAERHLQTVLKQMSGVTDIQKINLDGQPDFELKFRRKPLRIECKNVSPETTRGLPRVDFQKTRAGKGDPCSRYYSSDQFEVLAACIHPVTGTWDFRFFLTRNLAPHKTCGGKLADRVLVGPTWAPDLAGLYSAG